MKNCETCVMLAEMMGRHQKEMHMKDQNEKVKALEDEDED